MSGNGAGLVTQLTGVADLISKMVDLAKGLQHHLARVKSMPALARQRLDDVLVEIDNTFTAVDKAVAEHLSVALDPKEIDSNQDILIRLSGPELPLRVERDRGHCHEIGDIYWRYLRGVLDPLLAGTPSQAETHRIFGVLSEADDDLFVQLADVSAKLQSRAKDALTLQITTGVEAAKAAMASNGIALIDLRQKLQAAHLALVEVRNDFIQGMS